MQDSPAAETAAPTALTADEEAYRARLMRPAYRSTVLALVVAGFALNFLDRQILSILMQPIKEDLGLSDTALGFLSGLAFAIFYATVGIPVSRLADRRSRRGVMGVSMALWSAATALCGLAQNFTQLFLARVTVGIGEAGFTPSGLTMMSDYFPKHQRSTALGIVNTGPMFGTMLGFLIGGWAAVEYGWRAAFFIAGVPGILFALVFWLVVREPWRGMADRARAVAPPQPPMLATAAIFWRSRSYRYLLVGAALSAFGLYGVSIWMPSFLARSHGLSPKEIGSVLGPLIGVVGAAGMVTGGFLTDKLSVRDERWAFWMPAIASVFCVPLYAASLLVSGDGLAMVIYSAGYFTSVLWVAPTFSVVQALMPPTTRVTAIAWKLLVTNLVGLGLGPQAVGILSDVLAAGYGVDSLRYAMLLSSLCLIGPAIFYTLAARTLKAELRANEAY
ncbi:MFS transporter [Sphingomonas sp.]|uniref:spinster family MFS transporter n=1 Tax=Sphingomonas sp. TaxID=28214 RepID=UPI002D7F0D6A|nr:MFS transporter [Sphingomonas sp.]